MKRSIKRLFLLALVLVIISTIIILLFGKTYTISFNIYDNNFNVEKSNNNIEIINKRIVGNKYLVKVKSKKPGKVDLTINYDDYNQIAVLYVHKSMIITDNNYFGKSTCSEIIPISFLVFLSYLFYLLIKRYRTCIKDNLYQYKNIAYLGIIIFLFLFLINIIISIFNYHGLLDTINIALNSISSVSFYLFPIIIITFILVSISNIVLIIKEGKSLKNILGVLFGIFICILTILPDFIYGFLMKYQIVDIYNLNSMGPYLYNFFEALIYLTVSYLECVLIGTIIIAIKSIKKKVPYNKDYMIILGCKIRNDGTLTPLLKGRVDRALDFRKEQVNNTGKDLIFIPSGGKGRDEVISEAEAIKNYLLDQGIKEKNIILENKSTNTYENIKFSNKLINKKNINICFSTTNYHVLRAGLIATTQGIKIDGIGSSTKSYFWINAFIREFIGTLYSEKKKHIIVVLIIIFTIIMMIGITYLSNIF